ncbi:MAG: hypothetical protein ACYDDU_19960 [Dermatophilaceae bacterium]
MTAFDLTLTGLEEPVQADQRDRLASGPAVGTPAHLQAARDLFTETRLVRLCGHGDVEAGREVDQD